MLLGGWAAGDQGLRSATSFPPEMWGTGAGALWRLLSLLFCAYLANECKGPSVGRPWCTSK